MRQDDSTNKELLALENKYWTAVKEKDAAAAVSLSSDPCVIVGAKGIGEIDKRTLAGMLANAAHQIKDFALDDVHIRHITDDVAIIAYKVHEDLVVEGKAMELEAFDSSVWVRRDGKWICALHTEPTAGDKFRRH